MKNQLPFMTQIAFLFCLVFALACPSHGSAANADFDDAAAEIVAWNDFALQLCRENRLSPLHESRCVALQSIAVFDAIEFLNQSSEHPLISIRTAGTVLASVKAAVISASYESLLALFPKSAESLASRRDDALEGMADSKAVATGLAVGKAVAQVCVALRGDDGSQNNHAYDESNARAGVWRRTPSRSAGPMEPGWGLVVPFCLENGAQFRPEPPPAFSSQKFVDDFEEVYRIGRKESAERTEEQSDVARFWTTSGPQLWNQAVGQVAAERGWDAPSVARAYMILNVTGADALIATWDAKYAFKQWRPVTAIRESDLNPMEPDANWMSLIETPPFPDYPAGHTGFGGAACEVLEELFGTEPVAFSMWSPATDTTRQYTSFQQVSEEVENARVWGGAHWRASCDAGTDLGKRVAEHVFTKMPE